jgi:SPP1 family predicted phage head-tail adaptor
MPKRQTNKRKHRVDIHGNIPYKNELGETSYQFGKIKSIYAEIIPQTGSLQKQQADTLLTNVTHKIIVNYEAGKDITKNMQIHFRNHRFEVKYPLNPYYANEGLEIFCQELID